MAVFDAVVFDRVVFDTGAAAASTGGGARTKRRSASVVWRPFRFPFPPLTEDEIAALARNPALLAALLAASEENDF